MAEDRLSERPLVKWCWVWDPSYYLSKHRKAMADIESGMLYTTKELRKTLGANNETVIMD